MLLRARRLLRDADLIHAHMFGSSIWGALLAPATGVPLVTRDPTWSGERTRTRTYAYRYWIGPQARVIICPSELVARSIEDEGVPAERLRVIVNGVPRTEALPREAARAELGLAPEAWVIGIIANLREEKAHEVLLRAFARVLGDGRAATLCIVGDGPRRDELQALAQTLGIDQRVVCGAFARLRLEGRSATLCLVGDGVRRDELQRLARELRIEEDVVWSGNRADARRLASAFDTAVICSSWEGLPLAALEVLAAGVPLVASRVGALPHVVEDGAGVLFEPGDDEDLARRLAALIDDPELARDIGQRGLRRIEDRYRFERMVDEFAQVYDEVLENGSSRGRVEPGV